MRLRVLLEALLGPGGENRGGSRAALAAVGAAGRSAEMGKGLERDDALEKDSPPKQP